MVVLSFYIHDDITNSTVRAIFVMRWSEARTHHSDEILQIHTCQSVLQMCVLAVQNEHGVLFVYWKFGKENTRPGKLFFLLLLLLALCALL
jgi:hypothetical protein